MIDYVNFLRFFYSNRNALSIEFKKRESLKKLMKKECMKTAFQPILSLDIGSTVGFEVLNRPQSSPLFPSTETFYDYVGKSPNVFEIEQFLRNLSLTRFSEQVRTSKEPNDQLVFINIQPQVLADPSYQSGKTLELLDKYGLSPKQVVLELTEKEAVTDYKQFIRILEHYRRQGFRIAVDDAGTGYNSLQTIVYLKPEFIKLDKCLIRNIGKHTEQQNLVELLLKFASKSETKIIAEGIETLSELNFLQDLGVHFGQGYLLGKPKSELVDGCLPLMNSAIYEQLAQ